MLSIIKFKFIRLVVLCAVTVFNVFGNAYTEPLSVKTVANFGQTTYRIIENNSDINVNVLPSIGLIRKSISIIKFIKHRKKTILNNLKEICLLNKHMIDTRVVRNIASSVEVTKETIKKEKHTNLFPYENNFKINLGDKVSYIIQKQKYKKSKKFRVNLDNNYKEKKYNLKNLEKIEGILNSKLRHFKLAEQKGKERIQLNNFFAYLSV